MRDASLLIPEHSSLQLDFFSGGAMAELARQIDWTRTPLGAPAAWPQALKTTLAILFHSKHPMFLWWGPELIQFYNDAYLPSFGKGKHPAAMGMRGRDCWPEIWDIIGPQIEGVMTRAEATWHEDQLVPIFRNGRIEDVYWTYGYSPVLDDDGSIGGTLVVCQETTLEVLSRREIERAHEELQRQAEFEQHLVGIVSHDLRNPLNAIVVGSAVLADNDSLDERAAKIVLRMQSSAARAMRMIGDLLDFTQARLGGGIPIARAELEIQSVATQAVEEVRAAHPERRIELAHEGDGRGRWDADRIAQAIVNLVSNAVQYGAASSPVTVTTRGEDECVAIHVHNAGPPIPSELMPVLWQPLTRGAKLRSAGARSIGLGLYIVRAIVEGHGGVVSVESSAEKGTRFTLRLPRREATT